MIKLIDWNECTPYNIGQILAIYYKSKRMLIIHYAPEGIPICKSKRNQACPKKTQQNRDKKLSRSALSSLLILILMCIPSAMWWWWWYCWSSSFRCDVESYYGYRVRYQWWHQKSSTLLIIQWTVHFMSATSKMYV